MRKRYVIIKTPIKRDIEDNVDFNKEDGFSWGYRYKGVYTDVNKAKEQLKKLAESYTDIEWNADISFVDKMTETETSIVIL